MLFANNDARSLKPTGFKLPRLTGKNDGNMGQGFGNDSPLAVARQTCMMLNCCMTSSTSTTA